MVFRIHRLNFKLTEDFKDEKFGRGVYKNIIQILKKTYTKYQNSKADNINDTTFEIMHNIYAKHSPLVFMNTKNNSA